MAQFNRVIALTIVSKGQEIVIQDLRIAISINKTEKRDSNNCVINIYNLSLNTRNQISNDKTFIIVEAGYIDGSGAQVIFKGDITEVSYVIRKPETITRIKVMDGFENIRNKKLALSYESGVTTNTILQEASKALDLPIKNLPTLTGSINKVYNQGYNYGGTVADLLDDITGDGDLIWSVQNNELKVYPEDGSDTATIVSINKQSGMRNSPEGIKIQRGKNKVTRNGWKVMSLLQPLLEPGGRVEIESKLVPKAVFKVTSVRHIFDNIDGESLTTTEAIE